MTKLSELLVVLRDRRQLYERFDEIQGAVIALEERLCELERSQGAGERPSTFLQKGQNGQPEGS